MNYAVIFAGGTGQRMNTKNKPKQFLELNNKPIIIHTIEYFDEHPEIDGIVVVCLEEWIPYMEKLLQKFCINKVLKVVKGGDTGQHSIRNGLFALYENENVPKDSIVLIHDGVRPLITPEIITDCIECAKKNGNSVTVTPATETIISVNENDEIKEVMDRSICRMARAPQCFVLEEIVEAHHKADAEDFSAIDSAMLMSHYGATLHVVQGPPENIKITTPSDFYIFRAITESRENAQIL
ncbi:MAG: 2-C-methyl-D-erythritol 4-phosphate cytidylyltransferase [Clostridia bacterium]|nr:2-C-methyl-D-erythritol 4-phosphate cytidylyltransferase [Clostridia bacterium]